MRKLILLLATCLSFTTEPPCFRELQTHYFTFDIVGKAFSMNPDYIYQNQWDTIFQDLRQSAQDAPNRIQQKARGMRPNPLNYPFQAEAAEKLLLETMHEIFTEVMYRNYIINKPVVDSCFRYIAQQMEPKVRACLPHNNDVQKKVE